MPAKTLVYTTAFGAPYFYGLAERMIASLRKRGYPGDVAVLADRAHAFPSALDARVVEVSARREDVLVKAALPRDLAAAHDQVLFADSDVVFLRHPRALFEQGRERMAVSAHPVPLLHYAYNLIAFPRFARKDPRTDDHAINTGLIVFPGARYAEYADRWSDAWNRFDRSEFEGPPGNIQPYMERDQPVLQALLWNGELDYHPLPQALTTMPVTRNAVDPITPETVALHFCGLGRSRESKEEIARLIEAFTGLEAFADFEALFKSLREKYPPDDASGRPRRGPRAAPMNPPGPPSSTIRPTTLSAPLSIRNAPPEILPFEMTPAEKALLDARLAEASSYLEWGVGASTARALAFAGVARVDAVESGAEFLRAFLAKHPGLRAATQAGRLNIHLVDIGPTGPLGYPADASCQPRWPAYAALPGTLDRDWDLILVDGRFRVACILQALLLRGDPWILVHDFWNRPQYHDVLAHVVVVERADSMALLRRRPDLEVDAVRALLSRYEAVPD